MESLGDDAGWGYVVTCLPELAGSLTSRDNWSEWAEWKK
jgi:hypothetical protein